MEDFQLGPWTVHVNRHRLTKDGVEVRLEPRAMQVLAYLGGRAGEVASKSDILESVWDTTFVSDEALTYSIWEIRRALGDDAKSPTFIQTIPKKGYRLIATVAPIRSDESPKGKSKSTSHARVGAAVAVLAVSTLALGWFWNASKEHLRPGIGASGRPTLALAHFEDHTGLPELAWLSRGAPSMLVTSLAQTPGVDLVSLERLEAIARESNDADDLLDGSRVAEIAEHAGAGAIVVGSIFRSGEKLRVDVQLQELETGRVLLAHSESGEDVFAIVDRLTENIRDKLDIAEPGDPRPFAEVATASLEAYRLYSEGLLAERNARGADALAMYEAAIRIDPEFAMAYFRLSEQHYSVDEEQKFAYRARVLELLDKLPERQRLYVEAAYEKDSEKAAELWKQLIERYPDEEDAYRALSSIYLFISQKPEKAFDVMQTAVAALPRSGSLRNEYAYQLMERGRYPEAISELEVYRQIHPNEPNPHDSLGQAYLLSGEPDKAIEHYSQALRLDTSFVAAHEGRAAAFAVLGRFDEAFDDLEMQARREAIEDPGRVEGSSAFMSAFLLSRVGRYQEAEKVIDAAIEQSGSRDWPKAALHLLAALTELERGHHTPMEKRLREAEKSVRRIAKDETNLGAIVHLLEGVAAARRAQLDSAGEKLDTLEHILAGSDTGVSGLEWWVGAMRGEMALAREEWDAAETIFRAAEPESRKWFPVTDYPRGIATNNLSFRDGRARAEVGRGNLATAAACYRELLAPGIVNPWTAVLEPRYVLQLARILDAAGEPGAASSQYIRFLDLWKDADPGQPELAEARDALKRIQSD